MKDILFEKFSNFSSKIECLDHGFVEIVDCMPRMVRGDEESADHAIAEAARCSYQRGTKTINDDKVLIRYLMRHNHTSPFEMVEFKFHCKLPIFVARQMVRHRTVSLNELSGRYSEMPEETYIPDTDNIRTQSSTNMQGSGGFVDEELAVEIKDAMIEGSTREFELYHDLINNGVVREQSRIVLPLSTYTEWYWKINLKNLLHFLDLRCDSHSQQEIQVYGNAILELIRPLVPWTIEAWEDYSPYRGGMVLSKKEINAIRSILRNVPKMYHVPFGEEVDLFDCIAEGSKMEEMEWEEKAKRLGCFLEE